MAVHQALVLVSTGMSGLGLHSARGRGGHGHGLVDGLESAGGLGLLGLGGGRLRCGG
jgi:hypothetical protein